MEIQLFDGISNSMLYRGNITELPIKEEYIIQKCIEIYDDDEPCFIRKNAVVQTIYCSLMSAFEECISQDKFEGKIGKLPNALKNIIVGVDDATKYKIYI